NASSSSSSSSEVVSSKSPLSSSSSSSENSSSSSPSSSSNSSSSTSSSYSSSINASGSSHSASPPPAFRRWASWGTSARIAAGKLQSFTSSIAVSLLLGGRPSPQFHKSGYYNHKDGAEGKRRIAQGAGAQRDRLGNGPCSTRHGESWPQEDRGKRHEGV